MELLTIYDPPAVQPDPNHVLEGKHVRLVPLREEHAVQIQPWVVRGEEGLAWTMTGPADYGDSAELFVRSLLARVPHGDVPYAVESPRTGELIGYTRMLFVEPARRTMHIGGTWYTPHARGTAVNPECKSLLLQHAFEHCGFNRVQIQTDVLNTRSQRAIIRIGAIYEGTARADQLRRNGTIRDTWKAAIVRDAWPVVQPHLRNLMVTAIPGP